VVPSWIVSRLIDSGLTAQHLQVVAANVGGVNLRLHIYPYGVPKRTRNNGEHILAAIKSQSEPPVAIATSDTAPPIGETVTDSPSTVTNTPMTVSPSEPPPERPECCRGHFADFYNCIATHRLLCPDKLQEQCRAASATPTPEPAKPKEPEPPKIPKVRLRYDSARGFIAILNAVKTLADEVPFRVTGNGVEVRVMDPSHVAMLDLQMPTSVFEEYEWEKDWLIWVPVEQVMRTLPKPKKDEDGLVIETDPDHDRVRWTVRTGSLNRAVSFPTLEMNEEEMPHVKIDFKARFRLTLEALKTIVEDACKCSENIRIEATPEEVRFSASGDIDNYEIKLDKSSEELLAIEVREPSKAIFSLAYLSKIVPAAEKISEVVCLSIADSMPLKLDVEIPQINLSYYVAPYIE